MAEGAMFCGQFFVVAVVMCCTASVQADVVNTYYNMTNGFLDVVQPKARAEGMNYEHETFSTTNNNNDVDSVRVLLHDSFLVAELAWFI